MYLLLSKLFQNHFCKLDCVCVCVCVCMCVCVWGGVGGREGGGCGGLVRWKDSEIIMPSSPERLPLTG